MSRYLQLADFLRRQNVEMVLLSFSEVERILGSKLPASAKGLRAWWANDVTHAQAKHGWMKAGYGVEKVDFEAGVVSFRRVAAPGEEAFEAAAAAKLSQYYGVKLFMEVKMRVPLRNGGSLTHVFSLASEDGSIVGEVMCLTAGKTPTSRFPAISQRAWLLSEANVREKFIAFGGDPTVPRLWLEKFRPLVKDVKFYFVGEKVEALQ